VYGGPSGIGWLSSPDSVLRCVYGQEPTNSSGQMPDADAPELEQSVTPISEVVKVDAYLPGCPPHPFWIASLLGSLATPDRKQLAMKTVCSKCERSMKNTTGVPLQKGAASAPDREVCLLSQGVVCLGSVTLERCLAQCPNRGVACGGCAGPSADIVTEPHIDIRTMVSKRMHLLTGIDRNEIQSYIERHAKTFYAYSLASPVIYKKPTVEMKEWTGGDDTADA
jgi:F420-non-reducing hydrogenase small subunit